VRDEEAVDPLGAEFLEHAHAILLVVEQALLVDIIDIDELDAEIAQPVGDDAAVSARVRCREDAATRGCVSELDGAHGLSNR